jgi:hypothetical protein
MSHDSTARKVFGVSHETIVRRIIRTFDAATPSDVEAGARWYEEAAAVIAHLSPRTTWSRNVEGAIMLLTSGERANGIIGANFDRAYASLDYDYPLESFGGPKTKAFAANIAGDREAVTVDVWACRVADLDETLLSRAGAYDAIAHAYRLAARRRGVDPATMQATTWIVARNGRAS